MSLESLRQERLRPRNASAERRKTCFRFPKPFLLVADCTLDGPGRGKARRGVPVRIDPLNFADRFICPTLGDVVTYQLPRFRPGKLPAAPVRAAPAARWVLRDLRAVGFTAGRLPAAAIALTNRTQRD